MSDEQKIRHQGYEQVAEQQTPPRLEPSWISDGAGTHDLTLAENWLVRLCRERFRSRMSGKIHDYFVAHVADGVQVVAITASRKLVMVRQFRAGSRTDGFETPGGLLEPGEDPCTAGARELLEETGYAGEPPQLLGTLWPNPALLTTRISTIVIHNAQRVAEPRPDPTEELAIELVPIQDIPELIQTGQIDHAVCVAGLLRWLYLNDPARPDREFPG
jgi:8-oxo-dGTP pyrophosphatase MutT (NUDIX family)